jgi:diguanylate cyclase (GGDEF)-like protein
MLFMGLRVAILSFFCSAVAWFPAVASDDLNRPVPLTQEERNFIASAGPVRMCVDPDWVPFERINEQGLHEGIAADLVQLVAKRVGLKIEVYPTQNWEQSLAAAKAGTCQILSFLNKTPQRALWLDFTRPIFFDQNIIITREDQPYIGDLHGLSKKTVALPRGTMVEERIRNTYPNLNIILTENEDEAVTLVSNRKADLTIRSLIVAAYAIRKEGLFNLKISGQVPELTNKLSIGVPKGAPILRNILDKGVATITAEERDEISNKHVSVKVMRGIDYSLVWKIAAGSFVVILLIFYWNRKLSALNKELSRLSVTDKLTGLFNRVKIDSVLDEEIQKSRRSNRSFCVIMIDVDYFKNVNDQLGHQAGDRLLIELASLLKDGVRRTDFVGRWGGEEFILICPQTNHDDACNLAEALRSTISQHSFGIEGVRTASFGVTAFRAGDSLDNMIARVDAALYKAKSQGRNQVASSDRPSDLE